MTTGDDPNAYSFWQRDLAGRDLVMSVDIDEEILARDFERTRVQATLECESCVKESQGMQVLLSSGASRPLPELIES